MAVQDLRIEVREIGPDHAIEDHRRKVRALRLLLEWPMSGESRRDVEEELAETEMHGDASRQGFSQRRLLITP